MNSHRARHLAPLMLAALAASGCVALEYGLAELPIPIDARPAPATATAVEPFRIEASNILWVHGLFGHEQPDVAALLAEQVEGYDRVASFRVRQTSNIHQWLATHLSLTLFRMRRVVIEGELVRD